MEIIEKHYAPGELSQRLFDCIFEYEQTGEGYYHINFGDGEDAVDSYVAFWNEYEKYKENKLRNDPTKNLNSDPNS